MLRLSAKPGIVTAMLMLAVGAWWLGGVALQLGSGSADLHAFGARTAAILILAQWLLIALLAAPATDQSQAGLADLLNMSLPLWPLLALIWLTSGLSLAVLAASQVLAVVLALLMHLAAAIVASKVRDAELRHWSVVALGLAAASIIWSLRGVAIGWLTP